MRRLKARRESRRPGAAQARVCLVPIAFAFALIFLLPKRAREPE
jgi:hypothetical protein